MQFPARRLRRLRKSESMRRLMSETRVAREDLVYPILVQEGLNGRLPVGSMDGFYRTSVDLLEDDLGEAHDLGIQAVMLSGIPEHKDEWGTSAYAKDGIAQQAVAKARRCRSDMVIMADVCLCQYTTTGHCGIYKNGIIDNDLSIPLLGKVAASLAQAGADVVLPSAMMDGQVAAVRAALDEGGHQDVAIMTHTAKHVSALYTPFREAAHCALQFKDRKEYQVPYTNPREAMAEVESDIEEGADIVMIKPAMMYLDLVYEARRRFTTPVAAYNTSGEYALVHAAHSKGYMDGADLILEILGCIKRAGADIIVTYSAKEVAGMLP